MLSREPIGAGEAHPSPQRDTATDSVQRALDLLSRASADWRNGGGCESGPLHWPVSVNLARRELRQALEALENPAWQPDAADAQAGMSWWNGLTRRERAYWLEVADSAVPADAWRAFQAQG